MTKIRFSLVRATLLLAVFATGLGVAVAADGQPWLGVQISKDSDHSEGGVLVERVLVGSPAEHAGVLDGDVIIEIDGERVLDPAELRERMRELSPGDRVALTVERDGSRRTIDVRLGEAPGGARAYVAPDFELVIPEVDPQKMAELAERMKELKERQFGFDEGQLEKLRERGVPLAPTIGWFQRPVLGVELVDVTDELRRHLGTDRDAGVLVGRVLEDSAAERAGVRVGDLILAIDGKEVRTSSELARLVRSRAGENVAIEVLRDGRSVKLDASLPERDVPDPMTPRATRMPAAPPTVEPVVAPAAVRSRVPGLRAVVAPTPPFVVGRPGHSRPVAVREL